MKCMRSMIPFLLFLIYSTESFGQGAAVTGTVVDSTTQNPLEYATIIVQSRMNGSQITGTVTNPEGVFRIERLQPGRYDLRIEFMGYGSKWIRDVAVRRGAGPADVGTVRLQPTVLQSAGVEVSADKPVFEYNLDKKVIHVSQQPTVISGTAVDVLENAPSVTVDIEGNVELRGSTSFTVLIDNRPTVLDPNDALQQIPASTIENIEIITNPSAKYDPDGTAGIINIVTKKETQHGVNGIVNANAGLDDKYGGDFLLTYRTPRLQYHIGADYNKRTFPRSTINEYETYGADTTTFLYSDGDSDFGMTRYGIRAGLDWSIAPADLAAFEARAGRFEMEGSSINRYREWTEPGGPPAVYLSDDAVKRGGDYYQFNIDYSHQFPRKGHELSAQVNVSDREGEEESTNELMDDDGTVTSGQRNTETGPGRRIRMKVDYTLPLDGNAKFEAGYQNRLGRSEDLTDRYDFNPETGLYEIQPRFSHAIDYARDIHSLYSMFADEIGRLGFQAGLRGEYTDREIVLKENSRRFTIDRWDLFPTLHLSYNFVKGQQMMASYTRRIDRPRGWYLEPFQTWSDAYNIRQGNPDLKPEYIDSYEAGYQTFWGRNLLSAELYYRVTHNKTERVQSVYSESVTLHSIENVGRDYALGAELMANVDLMKWWNLNLMGNLYSYRIEGALYGEDFSRESDTWRLRMNNTLRFTRTTRLQITGIYNSPSVSAQGRREANAMLNLGLRQEFLNRALSATLQIRDLLESGAWESTTEGRNFRTYRKSTRDRIVMLTLTYNINNYQRERNEQGRFQGGDEGMEGGMEGGGEEF